MITAKLSDPTPEIATGWVIVEIDDCFGVLDAKINIDYSWFVAWADEQIKGDKIYSRIVTECRELHHDGGSSYIRYDLLLEQLSIHQGYKLIDIVINALGRV